MLCRRGNPGRKVFQPAFFAGNKHELHGEEEGEGHEIKRERAEIQRGAGKDARHPEVHGIADVRENAVNDHGRGHRVGVVRRPMFFERHEGRGDDADAGPHERPSPRIKGIVKHPGGGHPVVKRPRDGEERERHVWRLDPHG